MLSTEAEVLPKSGALPAASSSSLDPRRSSVCFHEALADYLRSVASVGSYDDHDELWSRKHGTTGFNEQLICLLNGDAIYVSDPLPGSTDAKAFTTTPVAEIIEKSGGGIGDKGYQGCDVITPRKTPPGGELSKGDKANNAVISRLRTPVERLVAHFKSWRIFHTDYRRPYRTYHSSTLT